MKMTMFAAVLVAVSVVVAAGCAFDPEQFDPECDDGACAGTGGTAGTGGSGGTGGQAPQACVPHSKAPCVCASGMPGDKWCYEDGSGYGQCICNTPSGTYCRDADCDTYGDPASCLQTSTPPAGYVQNANDCNDANSGINPGMSEIPCNGVDENCDGSDYCPQTGGSGGGTGGSGGSTDACNNACGPGTHCENGACVPDNTGGTGGSGYHPTDCTDFSGQKKLRLVVHARSGVTIQVRGAAVHWANYNQDDSQSMAWCGYWQAAGHYNNAPVAQAVQYLDVEIPVAILSADGQQDLLIDGIPEWMAWRGQVYLLDPGNTDIWHARYGFTANAINTDAALQADESCTLYFDGKAITDNYCRPLSGGGLHLVPNLTTGQNGQVDNPLN